MKFFAIVLAMSVAVASASPIEDPELDVESQLSMAPSNSEETAALEGKLAIFNDFCISTRDYVLGDIKTRSNNKAAGIFTLFFNEAEQLGLEAINVQRDAAGKLANQIRNPEAPIAAGDSEADKIIAEGQQKIASNPVQPSGFFHAIMSALTATKNVVTSHVVGKLNQVKSMIGLDNFTGALKDACNLVDEYDASIREQFTKTAQELGVTDVKLEQVPCVTARRVARLDGICKFAIAAQSPLIKAVTYRAN